MASREFSRFILSFPGYQVFQVLEGRNPALCGVSWTGAYGRGAVALDWFGWVSGGGWAVLGFGWCGFWDKMQNNKPQCCLPPGTPGRALSFLGSWRCVGCNVWTPYDLRNLSIEGVFLCLEGNTPYGTG